MSMKKDISQLATQFANNIVEVIAKVPFKELSKIRGDLSPAAPTPVKAKRGRPAKVAVTKPVDGSNGAAKKTVTKTTRTKRSPEQIMELSEKIVNALKTANEPLAISALAKNINMDPKRLGPALIKLRSDNTVEIVGERRNAKWSLK